MDERNLEPATVERRSREWDKSKCVHAIIIKGLKVVFEPGVSHLYPEGGEVSVEAEWCIYCKHLRPLGPANDSDAAQVEVRAAELVVDAQNDNDVLLDAWDDEEVIGYLERAHNIGDFIDGYHPSTWSGWLAAQIIFHDVEQKAP